MKSTPTGILPSATAVERSENVKLGNVSATYASQASCPSDCPFLNSGCYAEAGYVGIQTRRLNASTVSASIKIAKAEAEAIDKLSGRRPLRLHVVGDARTNTAARILSAAAKRYTARLGRRVWTYTHAWRRVLRKSWGRISVLASCESIKDAKQAMRAGYAAAIVVPKFAKDSAYPADGIKILPCPAQTRGVTCDKCQLCMDDSRLRDSKLVIAFEPHGCRKTAVLSLL